ncbi:hypothetical protein [Egicoccus halophilus]|uniref:GGDEF domain-containing protein n=1 Tax=Egicoccus halophilus TaxID=1670830 RepID=A0A8J3ACI4_9ACTN|nr:hypothetical protein [Egicoccus halophilus]GGI08632.1 hypothetical protein GCM10011354_30050 [Egicoccus halophilus]
MLHRPNPDLHHFLELELARSRRFDIPVSVLAFEVPETSDARRWRRRRRDGTTLRALANRLTQHVRGFDAVFSDVDARRLIVVAAGSPPAETERLRDRLAAQLDAHQRPVASGAACFPADGSRPGELLEAAVARMRTDDHHEDDDTDATYLERSA